MASNSNPPMHRVPLETLLALSTHKLVKKGNRYNCLACPSSFSCKDPAFRHWIQANCTGSAEVPESPHLYRPVRIHDPTHLGNQMSHSSHRLYNYRGLIYCNKCGARSGANQFRKLARPCSELTEPGQVVLNKINKGLMPPGVTSWPA